MKHLKGFNELNEGKTAKAAKTPAPKASKGMAKTQTVRKTGG